MQSKIDDLAKKGLIEIAWIQKIIAQPHNELDALTNSLESQFFTNVEHIKDTVSNIVCLRKSTEKNGKKLLVLECRYPVNILYRKNSNWRFFLS